MHRFSNFCVYVTQNNSLKHIYGFLFSLFQLSSQKTVLFTMAQQPPVGQDLIIIKDSRSHSDTPQSVGLLWTSDQLVAETST
jgi:hypothetical protein